MPKTANILIKLQMYEFHKCSKCLKIVRLYPDIEPDELFNETYIRILEKYQNKTINDPVSLFFFITRSRAMEMRKHRNRFVFTDNMDEDNIQDPQTPFQTALDNYLQKNEDVYSNVVEMYLICPNLSKLSRTTGIKKYQLKQILENAKNRIGFEYLKL